MADFGLSRDDHEMVKAYVTGADHVSGNQLKILLIVH